MKIRQLIILILTAGVWIACASKTYKSDVPQEQSMVDVPKELLNKFDVLDVSALPSPTPRPSPKPVVVVVEPKGAKKGKHRKAEPTPEPQTEESQGFVYPNRRPKVDPIWIGEKCTYSVTYLGMSAGDLTVEVMPYKVVNGRKVYHLEARAVSSKVFSLFYKVRDKITSFWDYEGLFSHRFSLELDETKQTRTTLELFDFERDQAFYWNRWSHYKKGYIESKEFFPMKDLIQDGLSGLYYVRTQDLTVGRVFSAPVSSEGKTWEAEVTVLRKETLNTALGEINTVVIKPETKFQGVLKKTGDSYIWLSDDEHKYVVQVEAKVKIGSVFMTLQEVVPGTPQ